MILFFAKLFSFFLFLTRLAWVIVCPIRNEKDLPDGRSQLEGDSDAVAFYKWFKLILRKHPYFNVFLFWSDKYHLVHQWWSSWEPTGNLPGPPHGGFTAFFAQIRGISSPKLILYRTGNIANLVFLLVTRRSLFPSRLEGSQLLCTSLMDYIQYLKSWGLSYDTPLWQRISWNSKVHDVMNAPSEFISIQRAFGAIFRTFFVFNVLFHKGVTGTFTVQP